jgi:deoxyhypusine synthase
VLLILVYQNILDVYKTHLQNLEDADDKGERYFRMNSCKMLLSGVLEEYYEIDLKDSWMYAAAEKNLPIIVPGWEDSTMGNIFASYVIKGDLKLLR